MPCPFSKPSELFKDLATARETPTLQASEQLGGYVVSRYDDIISVLDRPEAFSSRPTVPEFPLMVKEIFSNKVPDKGTLLAHDNPDHDRLRKSVASFFVPWRLERFEPILRATAHDLIDAFVEEGSVEIKSRFALPLPLRSIIAVAGLDPARWEWIGRCLALFGGITKLEEDLSIQQKIQDVLDLHEYVASVIEERRTDRRDDLISHIWNERDAGAVEMTDFEHLSMIPGLLLAGHETTTNFLSMGLSHLLHHGLWDATSQNDETRMAAIEELLRYESAITGMQRLVKTEAMIGNNTVHPGDKLFLAYNSGSRDSSKFENPDNIDPNRRYKPQHLGFGRGIHACLGAPFARLLLRTEFSVLRERLPNLRLETPYEDIQYHVVGAGRGPEAVRIAWDPLIAGKPLSHDRDMAVERISRSFAQQKDQEMVVSKVTKAAERVILITLQCPDGSKVPEWTPGAHIDIGVGGSYFRQYSICSAPEDRYHLQIAVQEKNGTGVSHYIHNSISEDSRVTIRGPRNNFNLEPGARKTILIAGGIGITPILPMAQELKSAGLDYSIVYLGRSNSTLAFVDQLASTYGERCSVWATSQHGGKRFDLAGYLRRQDFQGLRVYCCGPEELLLGVEEALEGAALDVLQVERFATEPLDEKTKNTPFDIILMRSGRTLRVPEDRSVLDVINEAGAGVMSTCNKGLCGTCQVRVLGGLLEHRDAVLSQMEKSSGNTMMTCVSRCKGKKLLLDLW